MHKIPVILVLLMAVLCSAEEDRPVYRAQYFTLFGDRVQQGEFFARAVTETEIESNFTANSNDSGKLNHWRLRTDLSSYPQFHSDYPIIDAIYNMSLEELRKDIRPDGTFMAGALWDGVWTRDISYSIVLSLAAIEPEIAKRSLMAKVKRERIVQDTGTGGSWPVSTDRMVWALAAWEIYEVTGDRDWLRQSFEIIQNSAADDKYVIFSASTGLVKGESSFLDWREQTYPRWMEPVDIYSAQALGTNAVHYRTYKILAAMARQLGRSSEKYDQTADRIRAGMNKFLWLQNAGYYGQYLYGREYVSLSPRAEALGEALAVLFDIAEPAKQDSILQSTPVMEYGIPCIYPQTVGIPPYHNNAVWPFVEAFWSLAAAKRENGAALLQALASIYRAPALFLANKENMVADTGSYDGTQINSDRQLWSVAGSLATVYRILVGMEFTEEGIRFRPIVPAELGGIKTLNNFHYRQATLSFRIEGHGSMIRSFTIDGHASGPRVPADIKGEHEIRIQLANNALSSPRANLKQPLVAPDTPALRNQNGTLRWNAVPGATTYRVYENANSVATTDKTFFSLAQTGPAEYQVSAVDENGTESFLSEPLPVNVEDVYVKPRVNTISAVKAKLMDPEPSGAVELDRELNTVTVLEAIVARSGRFDVSFRYANGSGPINTDNKCAVRTLFIDGKQVAAVVMPQRGKDDWSNWGYSSGSIVSLSKGRHTFELRFEPQNENMSPAVNRVILDSMRLAAAH